MHRILCWLGFHRWQQHYVQGQWFVCKDCGKLQYRAVNGH